MEITLGQQYNVGEKPTVPLYCTLFTPSHKIYYYYIGYKYKAITWYLNGFLDGNNIGSNQQYNVGEKPTVILYTYINRHAGTPTKGKTNQYIIKQ